MRIPFLLQTISAGDCITTGIVVKNAVVVLKLVDHAVIMESDEIVYKGTAQSALDSKEMREECLVIYLQIYSD